MPKRRTDVTGLVSFVLSVCLSICYLPRLRFESKYGCSKLNNLYHPHFIGQTRDVHIYRLISEQTIEENILKKAHQKKLLADMTIEGGNFTTTFFKQNTLKELFEEPSGLKELEEKDRVEDEQVEAPEVVVSHRSSRSRRVSQTGS